MERLGNALALAYLLHKDQRRKGSGVPYVAHLWSVAALVGEYGGGEDLIIAALLHDAAEDQGGDAVITLIEQAFGARTARLVEAASDTAESPKPAWRPRKEAFIARLKEAPPDVRLLVAADKLHNMQSMIRDYAQVGPALWDRFTGRREGTLWYHRAAYEALAQGWDHPILAEVSGVLARLESLE